jgi:hypothetical protein
MPCSPAKAKKLLKGGKAKVVKRSPFETAATPITLDPLSMPATTT